jgi:predicted NAD-dependent protein-ADP-ribosyltransferase YbiA (DUF1768 family)
LNIENSGQFWKTSHDMYEALKSDRGQDEAMRTALRAKFSDKNPKLINLLLDTDDAELINNTKHSYWGLGSDGKGQNNLGKMLMRLRDELRYQQ